MAPKNVQRRTEILSCVYRLLDGTPYDKISLADIAGAAGINKSLLQRYYPQKIDIIKEMLTELLDVTYGYMEQFYVEGEDLFQSLSNFNMLFFAAAAGNFQVHQFVLATVSSAEILDVWVDTICSWLRRYIAGKDYNMLDLRCALCFAMGGSMHLFQHEEELGIDYHFFCEKHIRAILDFLKYPPGTVDAICRQTEQWIAETDINRYLEYCKERIDWVRKA